VAKFFNSAYQDKLLEISDIVLRKEIKVCKVNQYETARLKSKTINMLPSDVFGSGSKASHQQYIMLRTISPCLKPPQFFLRHYTDYGITIEIV
jgi:hypothetical protein